jgi:hypothetical protein
MPRGWWSIVALLLAAPGPASAQDEPAELVVREAVGHYDMGRFEASLRSLDRAETATTSPAVLARVHLYRGVNLAVLGRREQAQASFALALQHDPQISLDPNRFKPAIVELLQAARARRAGPAVVGQPVVTRQAEPPSGVLRRATRPFAVTLALGGVAGFSGAAGGFALAQELGYHLSRSGGGPALGLAIGESFGSRGQGASGTSTRVSVYQVGAKLWWDLQPAARTAFYLAPVLQLSFAYATAAVVGSSDSTYAFALRGGLEAKLVVDDRWLLYARPIGLDLLVGGAHLGGVAGEGTDASLLLRYEAVAGAGVIF